MRRRLLTVSMSKRPDADAKVKSMPYADRRFARATAMADATGREQRLVPALCVCLFEPHARASSVRWPPRDLRDLARRSGDAVVLTLQALIRLDRMFCRLTGRFFEDLSRAAQASLIRHIRAGTCPMCDEATRAFVETIVAATDLARGAAAAIHYRRG